MKVSFFTWSMWHGKEPSGSVRLRVNNLLPYWSEADNYKYGEHVDVMIYQKVYWQPDWSFMAEFKGIQILDISDPDWLEWAYIGQTLEYMDAVTCPTENLANFLRQLTDKPVVVIPDRHDIAKVPPLKTHQGEAKKLVWFGYAHNASTLNPALHYIEREDVELTVISNKDPSHGFIAADPKKIANKYTFVQYDDATKYKDLAEHDILLMPKGMRAIDYYKSNNKTTTAWLAGLPVAQTAEDIARFKTAEARNIEAKKNYDIARRDYDIKLSVNQYKRLIDEISGH